MMALFVLAACGHKGPVQPLKQQTPSAPKSLMVEQRGTRFLIAWSLPKTNQDGTPLTNLEGFRVFKMRYDLAEDCPECRDTSVLMLNADLEYLREVRRVDDRLYLWDDELIPGSGYQYRIVPYNNKKRDGESTLKRVPFVIPPPAPTGLTASGHDKLVRLGWKPVADGRQQVEFLGYNVYRRPANEPFPFEPVNHKILTEPEYEDYDVQNDQTYLYSVRTVTIMSGNPVESPLSETVEATPRRGQ